MADSSAVALSGAYKTIRKGTPIAGWLYSKGARERGLGVAAQPQAASIRRFNRVRQPEKLIAEI